MSGVTLYRLYDHEGGRLLYVGIATNWPARRSQHRNKSAWWPTPEPHAVTTKYDTRDEAHAAEREAIRNEQPWFNVNRYGGSPPPERQAEIRAERAAYINAELDRQLPELRRQRDRDRRWRDRRGLNDEWLWWTRGFSMRHLDAARARREIVA